VRREGFVLAEFFPLAILGFAMTVPFGWIAGFLYHFSAWRLRLDPYAKAEKGPTPTGPSAGID
jgi:hypothetical protein